MGGSIICQRGRRAIAVCRDPGGRSRTKL